MGAPEGMYGFTQGGVRRRPRQGVATLEASIPVELPGGGRPNANYRYAFAEKMHGWDVWAFQVALNSHQKATQIKEDGFFGPITANAVKREQGRHHLTKDGVAGALTQNAIATAEAKTAEVTHSIPVGLLKGVAEGESASSSPRSAARTERELRRWHHAGQPPHRRAGRHRLLAQRVRPARQLH